MFPSLDPGSIETWGRLSSETGIILSIQDNEDINHRLFGVQSVRGLQRKRLRAFLAPSPPRTASTPVHYHQQRSSSSTSSHEGEPRFSFSEGKQREQKQVRVELARMKGYEAFLTDFDLAKIPPQSKPISSAISKPAHATHTPHEGQVHDQTTSGRKEEDEYTPDYEMAVSN